MFNANRYEQSRVNAETNNRILLEHTKNLPCKLINSEGEKLEIYFCGEDKYDCRQYLIRSTSKNSSNYFKALPHEISFEVLVGNIFIGFPKGKSLEKFSYIQLADFYAGEGQSIPANIFFKFNFDSNSTWLSVALTCRKGHILCTKDGTNVIQMPQSLFTDWQDLKTRDGEDYDPTAFNHNS